jgi:hypothetical protein
LKNNELEGAGFGVRLFCFFGRGARAVHMQSNGIIDLVPPPRNR